MRMVVDNDGTDWSLEERTAGGIGAVAPDEYLTPGPFYVEAKSLAGETVVLLGMSRRWEERSDIDLLAEIEKQRQR